MEHPSKMLSSLGIFPKKGLGQNFLADGNIARKIVDTFVDQGDFIVEVGPGLGALTFLLEKKASAVKAVEIDSALADYLSEKVQGKGVEIVRGDFLKIDRELFSTWSLEAGSRVKIVGNLPYSISGPLIFRFIELRQYLSGCFVMLQKEVARRLASPHGGKEYGAISVILQAVGGVKILFSVSRNCFYPVPDVDSSFIEIDFAGAVPSGIDDFETFAHLVNAAFSQRRKVIKNALNKHLESKGVRGEKDQSALYAEAGIEPEERPERVPVEKFVRLANLLRYGIVRKGRKISVDKDGDRF